MKRSSKRNVFAMGAAVMILAAAFARGSAAQPIPFHHIRHLIVIYLENWSFDAMFGLFPGADGIANGAWTMRQVQLDGTPYKTLPQTDSRIPPNLPVQPFNLEPYIPSTDFTVSPESGFYEQQYQIDGGRMDRFVAWSTAGRGLTMSYYDATAMPLGPLARQYTLCDHFFHSAFGQSYFNHMWLIAPESPIFPGAPDRLIAKFDPKTGLVSNAKAYKVTPDFHVVGNLDPVSGPFNPDKPASERVPLQHYATIGDRLSERGVSWAWYSESWNAALAGDTGVLSYHHQPFAYFANYAAGTPGRAKHLKDMDDFTNALSEGTLPAVSFVKPAKVHDMHPGRAFVGGQQYAADLVAAVQRSSAWSSSAIIITFDESGGRWDHVPPPKRDRWGPGLRVPAIIVAPFVRQHFVDHTEYETQSILKLIETRWDLRPLGERDRFAANITAPFFP